MSCRSIALLLSLAFVAACSSSNGGGAPPGDDGADASSPAPGDDAGAAGNDATAPATNDGGTPPACGAFGEKCCAGSTCSSSNLVCQNGTCGQARSGEIGKPCTKNGDCQSGICLPTGDGGNVCTASCSSASDCVAGWSCSPLRGQPGNICQCTATTETCNGKDDDCDGIVDDEPAVDADCHARRGSTYACTNGTCSCLPQDVCGAQCVDTSKDTKNCGGCNRACASGASCSGGQCQCPGGDPLVCGGQCVSTSSTYHDCNGACASNGDVATCGSSCTPCPTTANGKATCDGTKCGLQCNAGYVPCASGCCESCTTAGCSGLTWCDTKSGLCQPGCSHESQCNAASGQFCDLVTHACEATTSSGSCPQGWTYIGECSDGTQYCSNPNLPSGTKYVFSASCPAGSTARGGYYCSGDTWCCVPDN